ncbi:MAG: ABC transporter ATP-binding protein [Planctomycetes bacterium]|nr:ABC transporter ATP-binding protein [Planctomycetota bacterium]
MSAAPLRLEGLRFSHGDGFQLALDQLEVAPRERIALIGPSGCGKTTLLHLIAGILVPEAGQIEVLGQRIDGLSDAARRAFRVRHIGLVFQEFELLDYLTAAENLALPFRLHPDPLPRAEAEARVQQLAERLGLQDLLQRRPARLSQGERQRVALGRALVTSPGLVLGDEPTGNLDPDNARRSLDLLHEQAAAEDAAVLVVTHDHSLLDRFDRVITLAELRPEVSA